MCDDAKQGVREGGDAGKDGEYILLPLITERMRPRYDVQGNALLMCEGRRCDEV